MTTVRIPQDNLSADEAVGERIHQLMWRARISQTTFAPIVGLTQGGLSKKLRGERGWSVEELIAAARGLNTTVAYLVGETENPHPVNPGEGQTVGPAGIEPTTSTVEARRFATITPIHHAPSYTAA